MKDKSPLKEVRADLELSKSELAALVYPNRDNSVDKTQLAQSIALCEAGLVYPSDDPCLANLFTLLSQKGGHVTLLDRHKKWIDEHTADMKDK